MKVSAEELRQHYARLSDESLLGLSRGDLSDMALDCYDEELKRRGLIASYTGPSLPADEGEEPVAIATLMYPEQAQMARSILKSAEIPCYLENEHVRWSDVGGQMRLMVPAAYAADARALLESGSIGGENPREPWDGRTEHRFIQTNGIRMHYVEAGTGPLVVLLHGFPESWNSWRYQLRALAEEGYHAVAPDMRGYGQTDRPEALEAYDIFQLTGDIVGLIKALDEAPAILVGHDWGALLAPYVALLRPDLIRAVALLSVPFVPRRKMNESQWEAQKYPGKVFYQADLRSPGADQHLASNIRERLLRGLWSLSGDVKPEHRWKPVRDPQAQRAPAPIPGGELPPWLTKEDLDFLEAEYTRTGFTGGLNYYRNMDRNWELTPFLDGAKLLQRTLFIAGEHDPVLEFLDEELATLDENVPNLWKKVVIPGAGHWIQQERPAEINRLLIEFLRTIEAEARAQ